MDIEQGNKLIAEFMGCYGSTLWAGGDEVYRWGFKNTHITERWHESDFINQTPYHSSWNLLMPVVEKIEKMDSRTIDCRINIDRNTCNVYYWEKGIDTEYEYNMYAVDKITVTWQSVVYFLNWLNKKKQ